MRKELEPYKNYIDLELTNKVQRAEISKWLPFIGKDYQKAPEKILIVGLSHYNKGNNSDWTEALKKTIPNIECFAGLLGVWRDGKVDINGALAKDNKLNQGLECYFFNIPKRDLINRDIKKARLKLWNSVAFTQLVENPRIDTSKHNEIKKERMEGLEKLVKLIELIKPNHVLIMSKLWHYNGDLEKMLGYQEPINRVYENLTEQSEIRAVYLEIQNHPFVFHTLYHPSYFRYIERHNSLLKKTMPNFIEYIKK